MTVAGVARGGDGRDERDENGGMVEVWVSSRVGASSCMFFMPKTREIASSNRRALFSLPLIVSSRYKEGLWPMTTTVRKGWIIVLPVLPGKKWITLFILSWCPMSQQK